MNRREFIHTMACITIGYAALPEQIKALEKLYSINAPKVETGLIQIDDIWISGVADWSCPITLKISYQLDNINLTLNAFGGIARWVGTPEGRIICEENKLKWEVIEHSSRPDKTPLMGTTKDRDIAYGWIKFTDQELRRRTLEIKK